MHERSLDNVIPLHPEQAAPLPKHANVAIIGGGIMGASIAFHLAEAGVRDIVLIERDVLGSGSSAKPLGGVRATFSDPGNIVLGHRSLAAFETFEQRFGVDIGLRQVGYLFLCRSEAEMAAVEASTIIQNELGCGSRMITPAEAKELNPFLEPDALLGGSFSPRDGFAQPSRVVAGYARAARELGVTICERTEVLELEARDGAIAAVHTCRGTMSVDTVVLTTGAWTTKLAAGIGVDLPIVPVRRQIGFTPQLEKPYPTVPFTLDLSTTLYFHNHCNGLLLGISNPDEEPGFHREFSYGWQRDFDRAAQIIAPSLVGMPLEEGWAGLYENTPDHNALIGRARAVDGVLYAAGFSGHGFLQGPAVGELVRDIYLERESFMDPASFDARRFEVADLLTEVHII